MEEHHKEMQLLSCTSTPPHAAAAPSSSHHHHHHHHHQSWPSDSPATKIQPFGPSLDLQLSISVTPVLKPPKECVLIRKVRKYNSNNCVDSLKWHAAEQIRLATMEKAYAERVRELTRREMEIAQSEFARAHAMWERAREEVDKAEKMKERATRRIDSTCMEITCLSCRQKFRP